MGVALAEAERTQAGPNVPSPGSASQGRTAGLCGRAWSRSQRTPTSGGACSRRCAALNQRGARHLPAHRRPPSTKAARAGEREGATRRLTSAPRCSEPPPRPSRPTSAVEVRLAGRAGARRHGHSVEETGRGRNSTATARNPDPIYEKARTAIQAIVSSQRRTALCRADGTVRPRSQPDPAP